MSDYFIDDNRINFSVAVFYDSADRAFIFLSIRNLRRDRFQISTRNRMDIPDVVFPVLPFAEFESANLPIK